MRNWHELTRRSRAPATCKGFAMAEIAEFLLTAIPNGTGRSPVAGAAALG